MLLPNWIILTHQSYFALKWVVLKASEVVCPSDLRQGLFVVGANIDRDPSSITAQSSLRGARISSFLLLGMD